MSTSACWANWNFPCCLQGDAPKTALLEEFRLTPHAVLFATSSFWQGVDVQGEQLSCVIIDRLPFAVPSDPVVAARVKSIDADGGNAFFQYQVPAAVITLKQGFGRLIRSLHDRGLLVLLDNRILKKQYGKVFVESLPPIAGPPTSSRWKISLAAAPMLGRAPSPAAFEFDLVLAFRGEPVPQGSAKVKVNGGGRGRPPHMMGIGVK